MSNLGELARLIHARNETDEEISRIIGRPAEKGHVGEYIASKVFDIALEHAATEKAHDCIFRPHSTTQSGASRPPNPIASDH